jgi:hypothetical protein
MYSWMITTWATLQNWGGEKNIKWIPNDWMLGCTCFELDYFRNSHYVQIEDKMSILLFDSWIVMTQLEDFNKSDWYN